MDYETQPRDEVGRFVSRILKKKDAVNISIEDSIALDAVNEALETRTTTYYQLKEEERARGFVRPLRQTYTHNKCGKNTTIVKMLAENFARFPTLNNQAYCTTCDKHLPVTEFVWEGTKETVGS